MDASNLRTYRTGLRAGMRVSPLAARSAVGPSVAFAQRPERSAPAVERDVRGKRTYRIGPGPARPGGHGPAGPGAAEPGAAPGPAGLDYDELARRLLAR